MPTPKSIQPIHADTAGMGLPSAWLADATVVAAEGQHIAQHGVQYVVEGLIPAYGTLGFLVAYAKVGKTTLGQALASSVATGAAFLGRTVTAQRVLIIAAEDPPEYVAWLARHLDVPAGRITFYRAPLIFTDANLQRLAQTVLDGHYGLVLISSWSAVVQGLLLGENDNAGSAAVVHRVTAVARTTHVPWLVDAHAGKGEDQDIDADPIKSLRGASAAAAAADYVLSLRYANGPFGTQRRFSGRGRFVSVAPMLLDYDDATGRYAVVAEESDFVASTWNLIEEMGALDTVEPRSLYEIAKLAYGSVKPTNAQRQQVRAAVHARRSILLRVDGIWRKKPVQRYRLMTPEETAAVAS